MTQLQLRPDVQLMPYGGRWMVKHGEQVEVLDDVPVTRDPDGLLDAVYGGAAAVADRFDDGVGASLIEQLAERKLLAGPSPVAPENGADRADYFRGPQEGTAIGQTETKMLLVGLGDLGLAALKQVLGYDGLQVSVFDPSTVRFADVGAFYRTDELGSVKHHVVESVLTSGQAGRVSTISVGDTGPDAVRRALTGAIKAVDIVVLCLDQPSDLLGETARFCRQLETPLVTVEITETHGHVGPVMIVNGAGVAEGCPQCAALYRADRDPLRAAMAPYLHRRFPEPAHWRHRADAHHIAILAKLTVIAVRKALDMKAGSRPIDSDALTVDLKQPVSETQTVSRHPNCRVCFPVKRARADRMRAQTERWWQTNFESGYRTPADLDDLGRRLRPLVNSSLGFVDGVSPVTADDRFAIYRAYRARGADPVSNPMANAHHTMVSRRRAAGVESSSALSTGVDFEDPRRAETLAVIESLERFFTLYELPAERVLRRRYAKIADQALDPRRAPLYADEQYREPGFGIQKFDPDMVLSWMWAFNMTKREPVLVPTDLVFGPRTQGRIFDPTSNGAAAHSTLHDAILAGIYEILERDALFIAWLNRLSLPKLDIADTDVDPFDVRATLKALSIDAQFVDYTTDFEVPVVMSVLRDEENPNFHFLNISSSLDRTRCLHKLHREFVQFLFPYLKDQDVYQTDLADNWDGHAIESIMDHHSFYQSPEKNKEARFLTESDETVSFADHRHFLDGPMDTPAELETLVGRLARRGYEVIVLDCTPPYLEALGLIGVKVIIPGTQPLNCTIRRRVLGGDRLFEVPKLLGLDTRVRTIDDLNPMPHPFA